MEFNLRKLNAKDLFPLSTILSKIGVKQFKSVFQSIAVDAKNGVEKDTLDLGLIFDIAGIILENLEKCEDNIFKFLSSVSGMKLKEVEELSPTDFMELIVEVVKKEEFKDFFKAASRFVK